MFAYLRPKQSAANLPPHCSERASLKAGSSFLLLAGRPAALVVGAITVLDGEVGYSITVEIELIAIVLSAEPCVQL